LLVAARFARSLALLRRDIVSLFSLSRPVVGSVGLCSGVLVS